MPLRVAVLLSLQIIVPALKLAVGAVALYLARSLSTRGENPNSASWWVTGVTMAYLGGNNLVQAVAAVGAYVTGSGSAIYIWYMRLVPAGNQSRTFAVIAMGLLLTAIALRPLRVLAKVRTAGLLAIGTVTCLGAVIGWREGSMSIPHYMDKAVFDLFEFFALLLALACALRKDSMDRLLWSCLATYGFFSALNVVWYSSMSFMGVEGAWAPDPLYTQVYATAIHTAMLAIAWQRMRRLSAHSPVQSMMESLGPAPHAPA
jgi:hypothetical protein